MCRGEAGNDAQAASMPWWCRVPASPARHAIMHAGAQPALSPCSPAPSIIFWPLQQWSSSSAMSVQCSGKRSLSLGKRAPRQPQAPATCQRVLQTHQARLAPSPDDRLDGAHQHLPRCAAHVAGACCCFGCCGHCAATSGGGRGRQVCEREQEGKEEGREPAPRGCASQGVSGEWPAGEPGRAMR